ncbi:YdaU family protein [Achromobacter seleniivolatilans]|uniref:YdaU family protein n=1 Tax=Achromobacter seleniivolatilans TaxID=3047478 RepID=A0ABY9M8P3_9BURK|nr:YdaU family protein [Achromobacter sp. R39]WMD23324.1 YdaU family protein [Achromobacter sp. R39]
MTDFEQLPAPLTPPDCNLRGLPFMPLHTERLLDSDMMALSTGEEFKTALRLWCKSWNQEPAASLPDDDRILAHLAGKELPAWRKVKDMALRGFVKCADGRLYHAVIAAEAIKAMAKREEHQAAKEGDNDRKREEREDRKLLFAALREIGLILPAKGTTTSHLREVAASRGIALTVTAGHKGVTVTTAGSHTESHGGVTAKTGTGTGIYKKEETAAASLAHVFAHGDDPAPPPLDGEKTAEELAMAVAVWLRRKEQARGKQPRSTLSNDPRIAAWINAGVTDLQLAEAYDLAVLDRETTGDAGPIAPGFLDIFVAKVLNPPQGESALNGKKPAVSKSDPLAWLTTASGLESKGAELGIVQDQGEPFPSFKARVITAAHLSEGDKARARADLGVHI